MQSREERAAEMDVANPGPRRIEEEQDPESQVRVSPETARLQITLA